MDPMLDRLNKLREERIAREKARIEKLRELNLKKYNKNEDHPKNAAFNLSTANKTTKSDTHIKPSTSKFVKNNFHVNGTTKKPISMPNSKTVVNKDVPKPKISGKTTKVDNKPLKIESKVADNKKRIVNSDKSLSNIAKTYSNSKENENDINTGNISVNNNKIENNNSNINNKNCKTLVNVCSTHTERSQIKTTIPRVVLNKSANLRKSLAVTENPKPSVSRKSMFVRPPQTNTNQPSVFERLYQPKSTHKPPLNNIEKLQNDPDYLKKVIRTSGLILNKRHTVFDTKPKINIPVRRSISAVHFKRISKHELGNCIHKWSSIGDKLNNLHVKHVNEDDTIKEDKVVSAIKSERKKVTFLTPMSNFNTPKPEELQSRLKTWLQKRGKNLDSYQHLQCFGIHHLPPRKFDIKLYDDENKENIALDSDSDDDSYTDNMNDDVPSDKWRMASSFVSETDNNESYNTTLTSNDVNTDEIIQGALNDLTELLKEGFEWEQCARWLRAIRERFPAAPHSATYWECRAALEERRGDLPASVQCWEEAIAKGTEHSVVEANLDQLLDKFMQLKISPNSGKRRPAEAKLVDVKNVFKSTIIRFAVQQAKLRQSNQAEGPKYTVTPVRRSGRLSTQWSAKRTPLQVCTSVRQADEIVAGKTLFVPNRNLHGTP